MAEQGNFNYTIIKSAKFSTIARFRLSFPSSSVPYFFLLPWFLLAAS